MTQRSISLSVAAFAIALAFAPSASAQGYAVGTFQPSERGSHWFSQESLDLRGNGRLALGVVGDYAYRPLVNHNGDGSVAQSIVRNQMYAHFGASFYFYDRLRLAVNVPLQVVSEGRRGVLGGQVFEPPSDAAAVGDLRIGADVRILGRYGDAFTLAAGAQLFAPSGSPAAFSGDGEPRIAPRVLVAGQKKFITYAAKIGTTLRGRDEAFGAGRIGSDVFVGGAVGYLGMNGKLVVGPEIYASTVVSKGAAFKETTTPVDLLLGAHYDVVSGLRAGAGAGVGLTRGYGSPEARALLALEWVPGEPEREKPAAEDTADRDGDTIPDCVDACSYVAGPKSDDPAKNGCPPADADRDGIADDADACPLTPGVRTEDAKANGCPADGDHDGVPDLLDACPKEPGVRTDDAKTSGCPAAKPPADSDNDGVADDKDACPNEPGKPDADAQKNGCPKAFLKNDEIKITEQVKFEKASAKISQGAPNDEVLGAVLDVLKAHPEVAMLRVEGHTDNAGNAVANERLSTRRAEAVVAWLVAHGISKSQLTAKGLGANKPIDSNDTDSGRANNRRVEFHVEKGAPAGAAEKKGGEK